MHPRVHGCAVLQPAAARGRLDSLSLRHKGAKVGGRLWDLASCRFPENVKLAALALARMGCCGLVTLSSLPHQVPSPPLPDLTIEATGEVVAEWANSNIRASGGSIALNHCGKGLHFISG